MSAALLIARLVLAAVFAVAGVAKLADLPGSRRAVAAFGVPTGLAGVVGVALPLAELAVAVLLLPEATAWWGALGALLLLLLFCAAIGVSLARGRAPDCHCFGQLHSAARRTQHPAAQRRARRGGRARAGRGRRRRRAGRRGVDRRPRGQRAHRARRRRGGLLAVAACAALALRLLRAHGRLLLRIDALEQRLRMAGIDLPEADAYELEESPLAGEPAPAFALPALDGSTVSLDDLLAAGRPALLVFSDPGCGPCQELAPDVADWQRDVRRRARGRGRQRRQRGGRAREAGRRPAGPHAAGARPGRRGVRRVLGQRHARRRAGRGGRRRRRRPGGGRPGVEHLLGHGLALARGEGEPTAGGPRARHGGAGAGAARPGGRRGRARGAAAAAGPSSCSGTRTAATAASSTPRCGRGRRSGRRARPT